MADIPLRTYVEEIDSLVDKKQIDEAIAHCKHILTYYPKHLDTYQALGKALLEKGRHADAADIFNRVLSALPDDYVSHIGMSIVCEDQGNIEGALQHMERAYEAMPSNPAIQDELRRLYGRRDGLMPPRTRLTRGALARMYVRGGLFAQAEAELKKAISDDPKRLDLSTALAQVYWKTNRRQEAADICAALLEQLPYSQEANRMLADLLLAQGRTADLVPYRQRLEALDPYAAFADPHTDGHGPAPKAESILIPKLDYTPDMAASAASTPEWVTSIGATLDQPRGGEAPSTPDWLPQAAPSETEAARAAELPDWLQGAQVAVGSAPASPAAVPSAEGEMPDWMKATVTTPLEVPDWMKAPPPVEEEPPPDESADLAAATIPAGEVPDWMKDMVPPAEAAPSPRGTAALTFNAPEAPAAPAEPEAMNADEALQWLEGLALQQGAKPEEMVTMLKPAEAPAAEEMPEWLRQTAAAPEAAAAPAEALPDWLKTAEAAPAEELPSWMQAAPASAEAAEEVPEWLKEAAPPAGAPPESLAARPPAVAAPAEAEKPDWLKQMEAEADAYDATLAAAPAEAAPAKAKLRAEELPDFLQPASTEAVERAEQPTHLADELEQAAEELPLAPAEIPDWLKAFGPAAVEPEPEPAPKPAETGEWLETTPPAPSVAPLEPAAPAKLGAKIPERVVRPAEEAPAAELPSWMQELPPGPTDTVGLWLAKKKVPEWLHTPEEEAQARLSGEGRREPAEEAPKPSAPPIEPAGEPPAAAQPAAAQPEMSEDDALRWLENLAAQQGARPEELITKPEERLAQPPAWVSAAAPAAPESPERPGSIEEQITKPLDQMPAWLTPDLLETAPAEPAVAFTTSVVEMPATAPAEAPVAAEAPTPAAAEELPTWLQPQPVAPEAASAAELPDWLKAPEAAAPAEELPDWLKEQLPGAIQEEAAPVAAAELPDWLAAQMPAAAAPAEAEKPDWLKQMEAEADAYEATLAAAPAAAAPPAKAKVRPDELPDFLQLASTEAVERAEQPTHLAEELEQEQAAEPEEAPLAAADIPDWLKMYSPAAVEAEPEPAPKPAEAIEWLEGTPPAAALAPSEPVAAEPSAEIPEWVPRPVETPEAAPMAEVPNWVQEPPPGPTDTVSLWLAQQKIPEWLRKPEEEEPQAEPVGEKPREPAEEAPQPLAPRKGTDELATKVLGTTGEPLEAAPAAAEPAAAQREMDEDEALRWLENLAAQQGARPEELITKPEERLAQPPAWVAASAPPAAEAEVKPAPEPAAPPTPPSTEPLKQPASIEEQVTKPLDQLPSWLTRDIFEAAPAEPPAAVAKPAVEAPTPAAAAESTAMGEEEEALRWLESLAVKQGVRPEELITKAEERPAQPPAWVEAEAQVAAEAPKAPVVPAGPAAEAPAPPAVEGALPAAMGEDEALRWLESLAVTQGARPEELITKPEERLAQPPAWVAAEAQMAAEAPEVPAIPAGPVVEAPAPVPAEPAAEAPAPAEAAPSAAMTDDEALRWLESLAIKQGARGEEMVTRPEERLAQPPAWVAAEAQAAAEAPKKEAAKVEPPVVEAGAQEPELPAIPFARVEAEPQLPAEAPADGTKDERLSKLAGKLAASRRAKEAEVEARFAAQRAQQEAARRAVEQKLERKPAAPEPAPEPAPAPPVAVPAEAAAPAVTPAAAEAALVAAQPEIKAAARPARAPAAKPKEPAAPKVKKIRPGKSPYAVEAPENVLALARQRLAEGDSEGAAEPLAYLAATNQMLPYLISDLEAYTARQFSAPLLQILGDAYMKTNQLQRALETYRQALGHL